MLQASTPAIPLLLLQLLLWWLRGLSATCLYQALPVSRKHVSGKHALLLLLMMWLHEMACSWHCQSRHIRLQIGCC